MVRWLGKFLFLSLLAFLEINAASASEMSLISPNALNAEQSLSQGLQSLFSETKCTNSQFCFNEKTKLALTEQALQFKKRFDTLTQSKSARDIKINWNQAPQPPYEHSFTFESLYQRKAGHPSNLVHGILFLTPGQENCQEKKPATILIHKISNNITMERRIAKFVTGQNRGAVMIIYLPEYGPRHLKNESLITADKEAFAENILQALVDIHQAREILSQRPDVDANDIGLTGFSLGGMISLISAGIDPVFDRYLTLVGGGDLANVMSYKYRHPEDTGSETARALKDVQWSTDEARYFLSQFDAITWAHQIKNKKITMINAVDDELLDKEISIEKLFNIYKKNNPQATLIEYVGGGHVVDFFKIGFKKSFKQIVFPLLDFMNGSSTPGSSCSTPN